MPKIILGTFILWLVLNGRLGKYISFVATPAPEAKTEK